MNRVKELGKLKHLVSLCNRLYETEICGGLLHIVLDDGNMDDGSLIFCYRYIHESEKIYENSLEKEILHMLMMMDYDQRKLYWYMNKDTFSVGGIDIMDIFEGMQGYDKKYFIEENEYDYYLYNKITDEKIKINDY